MQNEANEVRVQKASEVRVQKANVASPATRQCANLLGSGAVHKVGVQGGAIRGVHQSASEIRGVLQGAFRKEIEKEKRDVLIDTKKGILRIEVGKVQREIWKEEEEDLKTDEIDILISVANDNILTNQDTADFNQE